MVEYVLLEKESHKTFQCKLNQWRHSYRVKVLWMDVRYLTDFPEDRAVDVPLYFALIERTKKQGETKCQIKAQ